MWPRCLLLSLLAGHRGRADGAPVTARLLMGMALWKLGAEDAGVAGGRAFGAGRSGPGATAGDLLGALNSANVARALERGRMGPKAKASDLGGG